MKRTTKYSGKIPRAEHTPAFKVLAEIKAGILADMGSVMEFLPMYGLSLRNVRPFADDKDALCSDWHRIGNDMWRALNKATTTPVAYLDGVKLAERNPGFSWLE